MTEENKDFDPFNANIAFDEPESLIEVSQPETPETQKEIEGETTEGENQEKVETPTTTEEEAPEKKEAEIEESWTKTAVLDERRKRQELERKVEELTTTINNQKKDQEQPEVKKPDILDDPEAALSHTEATFDKKLWSQKVAISESFMEAMADKYPDYTEMKTKFVELANKDEYLTSQLRDSPNPALFAYQFAKNHARNLTLNDPNYEAQLKEKMRKEILQELSSNQNPLKKPESSSITIPSLSNATSTMSNAKKIDSSIGDYKKDTIDNLLF